LEDLHTRGMPGGPVRRGAAPAAVPVPPVGVRRAGRRAGRVRSRPSPAPAARAGRRPVGVPDRARRLPGAGRPGLVEQTERGQRVIRRIFKWFDDRLGAASFARRTLNKVFPDHWSFMLGELALYCFIVLVLTGTFLAFFYVPDQREIVYRGPYTPLFGQHVSRPYHSTLKLPFD